LKITEVRVVTCDIPLARPIIMGDLRYDSRDYIVVEVRTDEGLSGVGFGMARYAPVAAIVERNLAPLLVGQDPMMNERLWESMYFRNLPIVRGIFMRALSAVDIALWDLKGKVLGAPVWKLLGGARTVVPALMAGGYVAAGKTNADLGQEIADYVSQGFKMIKIGAGQLGEDTARLQASREAAGEATALMYDAHWAWRDVAAAARVVRGWDRFRLDWIEDPFPTELLGLTERFRRHTGIPLAVGEDLMGRSEFEDLMQRGRADIIRVDVTTSGGFTEVVKICALAAARGIPVSPHIFPELHVHLAAAFNGVHALEVTDRKREIDVAFRLLKRPLEARNGEIAAPDAPGLGVEIDWSAVAGFSGTHA
jgi:L-alanine-DL-glutamate epimerase-like enolase superfamily enzyme